MLGLSPSYSHPRIIGIFPRKRSSLAQQPTMNKLKGSKRWKMTTLDIVYIGVPTSNFVWDSEAAVSGVPAPTAPTLVSKAMQGPKFCFMEKWNRSRPP